MRVNATTPQEYLDALPEDRRAVIQAVRKVIRKNLPKGLREGLTYGMLSYEIPLKAHPHTPNGEPLSALCLAAQKNHYALYLTCTYGDAWLREEFKKAGKKLDMGVSCLRFKKLEDLPLDVIGKVVAALTPEKVVEIYSMREKTKEPRTK